MAHDHSHDTTSNFRTAFFINLAFTILEIVGGLWTNSLAILSDAVHDLGDSLSLGTAWYLEKFSRRAGDSRYSYGYQRFSPLGALINTVVLLIGSIIILSEAVPRIMHPESAKAEGMIAFAVVGIVVNGLAVLRMRGITSLNARVVTLHLLEDVLGWAAVLVVGVTLLFTDLYILDPILSVIITLYILFNVVRNLRKTLKVFLQAVPEPIDVERIEAQLNEMDGVCSSHHTHIWSLDGEHHVFSTHVVVHTDATREDVARIKDRIRHISDSIDVEHTTIEIEYEDEECGMDRPHHGQSDQ